MLCFKLTVTVTYLFLFSIFAPTPSWVHGVVSLSDEETTDEERIENQSAWYQDEFSSHLENGLLVLNDDQVIHSLLHMEQNPNDKESSHEDDTPWRSSTLLLIAFYEPWCDHSQTLLDTMEEASKLLQSYFGSSSFPNDANDGAARLKDYYWEMPILAKMDTTKLSPETQSLLQIGDVEHVPFLQLILIEKQPDEESEDGDGRTGGASTPSGIKHGAKLGKKSPRTKKTTKIVQDIVHSIEYIGRQETSQDIVETILFYWCRIILSRNLDHELVRNLRLIGASDVKSEDGGYSDNNLSSFMSDFVDLVPERPVFPFLTMEKLSEFVFQFGDLVFQHPQLNIEAKTAEEEQYIHHLLKTGSGKRDIQEDPFFVFIQCRAHVPTLEKDHVNYQQLEQILLSFGEFDEMAQVHMYRRDIAFFTIISKSCEWIAQNSCHGKDIWGCNGSVRVARVHYDSESGKWDDGLDQFLQEKQGSSCFNPLYEDEIEDTHLNMTQFTITQSTPSILWFDKATQLWAFPMYRKVHAVLFIDLHSPQTSSGFYNISSTAYRESRYAIASFQKASFHHQQMRPTEDVVFLIVPSTEVQVMNTFGIDIWTLMDEKCQQNDDDCLVSDIPTLPTLMITSRRSQHSNNMRRYYLPSSEIRTDRKSSNVQKSDEGIREFLSDYFNGSLSPTIKSEPTPKYHPFPSGVQIVTGNSFQKLVMESQQTHALVQFYSPSCGHCQRFQIIWKKVSQLIHTLHWDSTIDVFAMDMTQNEILHEGVDVRHFPAVYFFPLGGKDHPHQLKVQRGDSLHASNVGGINSATPIIEWMIELGELDEVKLSEMALNK